MHPIYHVSNTMPTLEALISFHYSVEAAPTLKLSEALEITDGYSSLHVATVGNPRGFSREDLSCLWL